MLQVLMEVLKALVSKLQSLELAVEPVATEPQEGAELFQEVDPEPGGAVDKDQVRVSKFSHWSVCSICHWSCCRMSQNPPL